MYIWSKYIPTYMYMYMSLHMEMYLSIGLIKHVASIEHTLTKTWKNREVTLIPFLEFLI